MVDCWGYNATGAQKNGTSANRATPVVGKSVGVGIGPLKGVKLLRSGDSLVCAEFRSEASCQLGNNSDGKPGNGSTDFSTPRVSPLGIGGIGKLENLKEIKLGVFAQSCALQKRNRVLCREGKPVGYTNDCSLFPVQLKDLR